MDNLVGKRLRLAREAKRLTQVQVKHYTNINNKTLSGYENGVSEPDIDTLKILAKTYETSIDYLVGSTDDPTPPATKQKEPSPEEYVLSAKTLADASIRMAELLSYGSINEIEFLDLAKLAYKKFGLPPVKGTEEAAHLEYNVPATGVFEKVAEEQGEYKSGTTKKLGRDIWNKSCL